MLTGRLRPGVDVADGRIRHHPVEEDRLHAGLVQLLLRTREVAVGTGRFSVGDHDQGAASRHRLFIQFVQHPGPEHHPGRNIHVVHKIGFHLLELFYVSVFFIYPSSPEPGPAGSGYRDAADTWPGIRHTRHTRRPGRRAERATSTRYSRPAPAAGCRGMRSP